MNWLLLKNSLLVSGLTMVLAGFFGFISALWLMGLGRRSRMFMLALAILSFALPPFLVTNCWLDLVGPVGVWRKWLPVNICSLSGTVWILSLLLWPITSFAVLSAWQKLQVAQLESDLALRRWALIRALLLPLSRGSLTQAAVLTFVLALNNFTVPAILQVKVLPAEIWVRFNATLSPTAMLVQGWPLILAPLLLLAVLAQQEFSWPQHESLVQPRLFRQQLGRAWFWIAGAITIGLCVVSLGLPLFQLISLKRTWTELPGAATANQSALWNSFWFAATAACLITGLSLIGAMLINGRRRQSKSVTWLVQTLLWLPLLVPGVLLGLVLIFLLNRPGIWIFYQSTGVVILAFVIRYFALGWHAISQAAKAVDSDLLDDARLNGASKLQLLRFVQWPQIAPQVAAAAYIVFLLCLWDVETMILIWPPGGETLALSIFNLLHYGHNAQVNALCLALLGLAVLPLILWRLWGAARVHWSAGRKSRISTPVFVACLAMLLEACSPNPGKNETSLDSQLFSRVRVIGHRGVGVGDLNKPRSVAVDRQDNLYVVDMTGRVQKFSSEGNFLLSWQMPQTDLGKPKGMARDHDGNIIVVEPHYQRVNHFTTDGTLAIQWGVKGTNAGQFTLPRAVAVNSRAEIYVSEYGAAERVQRFKISFAPQTNSSPADRKPVVELINSFGVAGTEPASFNRPEGLCVDNNDRVYVADSCNHRIQIFSSEGKFIRAHGKAGSGKGELSYPYDICVDAKGRQYVCEFGNSRIQVFDANDQPVEIIGGPGSEPGRFSNPWGVALDSAGNLYVADSQNHRIQKLIRNPKADPKISKAVSSTVSAQDLSRLMVLHKP
jgi:ABC-type Fe3+ transport system permease subunit/DNA-binding beta-propeller fold protein YncE